ncbi:MAG: alpha/beta fold hydrolase [Aminipila sp.]
MKKSVFKSEEKRDQMRNHYNAILSSFPFEQKFIETSYGETFALAAGKESDVPIILLHGSNSNSAFWFPELMALSSNYRVYAVDILGESGNSCEYRPNLNSDDFAHWMKEVQNALGIEKSILIGNSLGGWMSLKFSTVFPDSVSKLILIAAAGLAPIHEQFLKNVDNSKLDDGTVEVSENIIGESDIPKEVLEFMNLIAQSYDPIQELPLFDDKQLLNLNMPILMLNGQDDVIINSKESIDRLSRLIPSAKTLLISNCGHVITNSLEYIFPFMNEQPNN